jgi:hypothetical protein
MGYEQQTDRFMHEYFHSYTEYTQKNGAVYMYIYI